MLWELYLLDMPIADVGTWHSLVPSFPDMCCGPCVCVGVGSEAWVFSWGPFYRSVGIPEGVHPLDPLQAV